MKLENFLKDLRSTTSSNKKKEILNEYINDPTVGKWVQTLLYYCLDPFKTYGIAKINEDGLKLGGSGVNELNFNEFITLLDELKDRKLTGNTARSSIIYTLNLFDEEVQELLICVLQKDLKSNVSNSIVNSVFVANKLPKIPEFSVQLATTVESFDEIKFPVFCEFKFDGLRCLTIKEHDEIKFFSRNGKELDFPLLKNELLPIMQNGEVLDGEVFHKAGFQKLMTQARRLSGRSGMENIVYYIFDRITIDELRQGYSNTQIGARKQNLKAVFDNYMGNKLVFSEYQIFDNVEQIHEYFDEAINSGFEGIMIKSGSYECKRNKNWIKHKPEKDGDFKVIDLIEGTGKYKGKLGAIKVLLDTGKECQVGSGFTDKQREEFWNNPGLILNHIVEVYFQEYTTDKLLRFPVFYRTRPDKDIL